VKARTRCALREKRLFVVIPAWWYYPDSWRFVADESGLPDKLPMHVLTSIGRNKAMMYNRNQRIP
jgi:hypothetical protein